jgi:oxaloacetate decarboxylase beta subunit
MEILRRIYEMTAISEVIKHPAVILMWAIGFFLLYLGIRKKYEPLLLVVR